MISEGSKLSQCFIDHPQVVGDEPSPELVACGCGRAQGVKEASVDLTRTGSCGETLPPNLKNLNSALLAGAAAFELELKCNTMAQATALAQVSCTQCEVAFHGFFSEAAVAYACIPEQDPGELTPEIVKCICDQSSKIQEANNKVTSDCKAELTDAQENYILEIQNNITQVRARCDEQPPPGSMLAA